MDSQYHKFIDMLSLIVARIDRPDTILPEMVRWPGVTRAMAYSPLTMKP